MQKGRNPTIQIRAIRTAAARHRVHRRHRVAIHHTDQGNSDGGGAPARPLPHPRFAVAIPPYRSGQFGLRTLSPHGSSDSPSQSQSHHTDQGNSDYQGMLMRLGPETSNRVAIPPYRSGQFGLCAILLALSPLQADTSQSHHTDQAIRTKVKIRYVDPSVQKSQSHHTDQGNSDYYVRVDFRWRNQKVAIPPYRSGQFGLSVRKDVHAIDLERRNPTIQIRAIRTKRRNKQLTVFVSRNPTIQIRAIRTPIQPINSGLRFICRNPTIQIRAIRTKARSRKTAPRTQKSRNPTIQIRAIRTRFLCTGFQATSARRNPTIQIRAIRTRVCCRSCQDSSNGVAIPPYRSGQFGPPR